MSSTNWKKQLGLRLAELRKRARNGRGFTHQEASTAIDRNKSYLIRLELHMEGENPTLDMLHKLILLYGCEPAALFTVLVPQDGKVGDFEVLDKVSFILQHGPERTASGLTELINAMYERTLKLNRVAAGKK